MSNLYLSFSKAGLLTTVQDQGRMGYQAFGVPVGGSMDQASAKQANILVGNSEDTPVLEITMIGPEIYCSDACQIAITGADLSPTLNGNPIPNYTTINILEPSTIGFGKLRYGCRAYLAVRGSWLIEKWLGSCSAVLSSAINPIPQSLIKKNSTLAISPFPPIATRTIPVPPQLDTMSPLRVPVFAGPEWELFASRQIAHFFSQVYSISSDSNRMGYRLNPTVPEVTSLPSLISSGVVPGTIQITPNGSILMLMADAQTTGGYPRIGNLPQVAIDRLAQAKPGDKICFEFQDYISTKD